MASNKVSRLNLHQLWSFSAALIRCMRTSRSKAAPFANIDRACQLKSFSFLETLSIHMVAILTLLV